MKFTRQEMDVLADLVLDEFCKPGTRPLGKSYEQTMRDAALDTGWTLAEFEAICRRRWNGPDWVQ